MTSHVPRWCVREGEEAPAVNHNEMVPCPLHTLSSSSMTSVMVARLAHTPSGVQLVMHGELDHFLDLGTQ